MEAPLYSDCSDELFSPPTLRDPHPLYARVRGKSPIARIGNTGVHLVTTWELIDEAVGRPEDFSANLTGVLIRGEDGEPTVFELPDNAASRVIATADDPSHAIHRNIVRPCLTASRITELEPSIRSWAGDALDEWFAQGAGDFVPVAERIPARAVARLLGLPEDDVERHRRWAMMGGEMLAGDIDLAAMIALAEETARMITYLGEHLDRHLIDPLGNPSSPDAEDRTVDRTEDHAEEHSARHSKNRLAGAEQANTNLSLLAALAEGVRAENLDHEEAVAIAAVMFGAGGESTAALLASAVRYLAEHPSLANRLRQDHTLIPAFVEEIARMEPPFKFHYRAVRRDCELGGYSLKVGDRLMLVWASANRDDSWIDDANNLRLDRSSPRDHRSFGRGIHFCVGAALARLETKVVCEELLTRTTQIALAVNEAPVYAPSIFVRRLERLPLTAS